MRFELEGERYRGRFDGDLGLELARRWLDEAHGWFESGAELTPLLSPLGPALAKQVAPGRGMRKRRRRAQQCFDDALALAAAGVATPRPLAALLPRRRGDPAAFVALFVELPTLGAWAQAGAPGDRAGLAHAAAETLLCLHRAGLRHRDLKAPNVLVDARRPGVVLLDLDGVRRQRPGFRRNVLRSRARDLARLLLSLQALSTPSLDLEAELWDPLFARYAAGSGDPAPRLARHARRWATAHAARNRRRGRPTA